ncbi:helicase HerA domain-containing protein [Alishewanella longhuensis]
MKNELAVQQDELNYLFAEFDDVVLKNALTQLNFLDILPIETNLNQVLHDIRVRKLTKIVYNKEEDNLDKFTSVFSTLHSSRSAVILIVKGFESHVDIYIAMKKQESESASSGFEAVETLDAAMAGNFPGADISTNLVNKEIYQLLEPLQGTSVNAIAAVSGVPSLKEGSKELFSQGLEKLIDGMRGREYTVLINATPVSLSQLSHVELAYQKIHTTLSVFEQQQISYSENESLAVGQSLTEGITKTLTNTISDTQTLTSGTSKTETTSQSSTKSDIDIKRAISGAISGAAAGAIGAGSVSGGLTAPAGALVGGITGLGMGLFGASKTSSTSESFGTNESKSVAKSTSESNSEAASSSTTRSDTATKGNAKSLQFTEKNRTITSLLSQIDAQLERLEECKSYGMWNWGAYFLGGRELDVKLGAELYSGILRGESSGLERNVINVWSRAFQPQQFDVLQMYLSQLNHPQFLMPTGYTTDLMASTSLVSTKEMALAMGFPRQSLPGIPVIEAANFARSVLRIDNKSSHSINIGKVSNLGSVDKAQNVNLDIRSLTSHIFVTGSTGAGKSNAIYAILHKLHKDESIPFLIVEPAKGEYKAIFGGDESVSVFGTNPKFTPLIKLNPFSFPDGIHVMEHIDRLIEILNAVWPMYAAMPAILKEAVELTYERAGWDLLNSECSSEQVSYPDFHDLLTVLPEIINKSDYSQEMKGNYSGALITRVKSLTNGYYSTIFQKDEISPEIIFDQSCIIDLSRVGSSETKSLLMGILFLKLNQHRMANATSHNAGLKHITVLEEAHNLFRRTSTEQGQESANLQGKSVEDDCKCSSGDAHLWRRLYYC